VSDLNLLYAAQYISNTNIQQTIVRIRSFEVVKKRMQSIADYRYRFEIHIDNGPALVNTNLPIHVHTSQAMASRELQPISAHLRLNVRRRSKHLVTASIVEK
jgi:hypothetical protein